MVLVSASPVFQDGKVAGVLWGGEVLNRDDRLVDKIRDILYQNEKYQGRDIGLATLFLKNVRISTTYRNPDGSRAIGSIVAWNVAEMVLGGGNQWVGTTPVVHKGYVAGYEPIRNHRNEIVGMLAVGMLEQKFSDMRKETLTIFLVISLFGVILVDCRRQFLFQFDRQTRQQSRRGFTSHFEGDFTARVQAQSANEIGELETTFNLMASSLQARDEEIERLNRQHLMRSEKLASIGRLAAGIAHEINNPLTSVLTFGSLLLRKAEDGQKEKLDIIVKETTRCREIVRRLLNFSRQTEPRKEECDINLIVENALSLTKNQLKAQGERHHRKEGIWGSCPASARPEPDARSLHQHDHQCHGRHGKGRRGVWPLRRVSRKTQRRSRSGSAIRDAASQKRTWKKCSTRSLRQKRWAKGPAWDLPSPTASSTGTTGASMWRARSEKARCLSSGCLWDRLYERRTEGYAGGRYGI